MEEGLGLAAQYYTEALHDKTSQVQLRDDKEQQRTAKYDDEQRNLKQVFEQDVKQVCQIVILIASSFSECKEALRLLFVCLIVC